MFAYIPGCISDFLKTFFIPPFSVFYFIILVHFFIIYPALDGYNTKLLARLIDKSKITVDESGNITGLEEAVKAVSDEFPAVIVKKESAKKPFVPINPAQQASTSQTMNDLIRSHR